MINRSVLIVGILAMLLASACSSSTEETAKKLPGTTTPNSNTVEVSNGTQIGAAKPTDANVPASNVATDDQLGTIANRMDGRLKQLRDSGDAGPETPPEQIALQNARPAPDNSTFTSYLTDAGYEVRSFKNHPQLLKVEKKTAMDGKLTLKVFLRDGKVIDLPGKRLDPLSTTPAANILNAIGVNPAPAPQAPTSGPPPTKKSGE